MRNICFVFVATICLGLQGQSGIIASMDNSFDIQISTQNPANQQNSNGSFTDPRDGKKYKTIQLNRQTWMAENLNFEIKDESWVYNNDAKNGDIYGRLYTWEVAKKVCPPGWHLPNDGDWAILTNYLGGTTVAGGKMKTSGTSAWKSPNVDATNESGFSAVPGGYYVKDSGFGFMGYSAHFWTSEEALTHFAYYRLLYFNSEQIDDRGYSYKTTGFSVRCVKD